MIERARMQDTLIGQGYAWAKREFGRARKLRSNLPHLCDPHTVESLYSGESNNEVISTNTQVLSRIIYPQKKKFDWMVLKLAH